MSLWNYVISESIFWKHLHSFSFQKFYCLIFLQPKICLISRLIYVYICFHGCKFWHIFHELIFTDGENLVILCKLIIKVDKFVLLNLLCSCIGRKSQCKITEPKWINQHILSLFPRKRQKAEFVYSKTETTLVKKFGKKSVGIHFCEKKIWLSQYTSIWSYIL